MPSRAKVGIFLQHLNETNPRCDKLRTAAFSYTEGQGNIHGIGFC